MVNWLFGNNTADLLYQNLSAQRKEQLLSLFRDNENEQIRALSDNFNRGGFQNITLDSDVLLQVYQLVKANESDQLLTLLAELSRNSVGDLDFTQVGLENDSVVLSLEGEGEVRESQLNPVLLAIHSKSNAVLKALLARYNSLRSTVADGDFRVHLSEAESAPFSNLALPLILRAKDLEALNVLLRHD